MEKAAGLVGEGGGWGVGVGVGGGGLGGCCPGIACNKFHSSF